MNATSTSPPLATLSIHLCIEFRHLCIAFKSCILPVHFPLSNISQFCICPAYLLRIPTSVEEALYLCGCPRMYKGLMRILERHIRDVQSPIPVVLDKDEDGPCFWQQVDNPRAAALHRLAPFRSEIRRQSVILGSLIDRKWLVTTYDSYDEYTELVLWLHGKRY